MEKLGALDANFLYSETGHMGNHIASVQILELPEGKTPEVFVKELKQYLGDRIHLLDYLTRKIKRVPGNLDHPVWVYDRGFDIDNHLTIETLEAPGDRAQLDAKIAEIHSRRMDLDRPLWAMTVITGLQDGHIAYYNQIHHAAVDGMSGQAAIMTLMDETPDHPPVPAPENFPPREQDTVAEIFRKTFENLAKYQFGGASRMMGMMESAQRLYQRAIDPSKGMGALALRAPRTRFNHAVSPERTYATGEIALADIKQIGKPLGCTLNDVLMAICAGGLRRYLERGEELPAESLIAGCPVSLRDPLDTTSMGNNVTMMSVDLATTEALPIARLLKIKQSAGVAKGVIADMASGYFPNVALPGLPAVMQTMAAMTESTGAVEAMQMPFNVLISNVPGPRTRHYSNGAKMLTHYPVSIPAHGLGVNITVQSYVDTLYIGITACAKALPDADRLRDDLLDAFVELKQAVQPASVQALRPAKPAAAAAAEALADQPKVA